MATVDENGNINIVGEDETQIIIHLDGANDQVITIKVTLPELEINKNEINLQVGEEAQTQQKDTDDLTVKLRGEDKIDEATFTSSDESVATVDENGHITAVGEGEAIITVSVDGAKKSEVKVNVYDPDLHKIILKSNSTVSLQVGQTEQITILIKDQDKTAQAKYTIEDSSIVSVSASGLITALKEGTTKIKVHLDDTEADVTITVDVYDPDLHTLHYTSSLPTQIVDNEQYMVMYEGETGHIQILVGGVDKTDTGVYTSGNTTILTVDENENEHGLIRAKKEGRTTINLHHDEALEGDVVVNVKVKEKPTLITTNLTIIQGYTGQIIIKNLSGEDITNKFTFTPENSNIATVDNNGLVTLKQNQNTNITATYNDGTRTTTYQIPIIAQKTLTTSAGITATAFSAEQTQEIITILMDTGMISNENDVDNIVRIDTTNGLTQITITIDREDGTQVAVVAYENGVVKYIQTSEVQNKQVTVDVGNSNQNVVATENSNGTLQTYIVPGFYNKNNELIASWQDVTGNEIVEGRITGNQIAESQRNSSYRNTTRWDYAQAYNWWDSKDKPEHMYNILKTHTELKNTSKLVIPNGITKLGGRAFNYCEIGIETIVFPDSYNNTGIGFTVFDIVDPKITNYTINSTNPNFDFIDGVVYTEDHKILVVCPMNKKKVTVLDGTTKIMNDSFSANLYITTVGPIGSGADIQVPNTVKELDECAWRYCSNLKWVELWDNLEIIGSQVFNNCTNIKSVYIPNTVTTITENYETVATPNGYFSFFAYVNSNVKIYCQSSSKPNGWSTYWNAMNRNGADRRTTYWNISRSTYETNYRQ